MIRNIINRIMRFLLQVPSCPYCLAKSVFPHGVGSKVDGNINASTKLYGCESCHAVWSIVGESGEVLLNEIGDGEYKTTDEAVINQIKEIQKTKSKAEEARLKWKAEVRT